MADTDQEGYKIGTLAQIWRYPMKSARGEQLETADIVEKYGIPGDRGWAIRDEERGEIASARRLGDLLHFGATYVHEPSADTTPPLEIEFPDGRRFSTNDPTLNRELSEVLGRRVTIWPRVPANDEAHFRRAAGLGDRNAQDLRATLGLLDDESLPDLRPLPGLNEFVSPLGTYFDATELSLVTTTALASLQADTPESMIDVRRFRPSLLIEPTPGTSGYPELGWSGRICIGDVVAEIVVAAVRCVVVTRTQAELPMARPIMRTLVRKLGQNFGLYLRVLRPGQIKVGDVVELRSAVATNR